MDEQRKLSRKEFLGVIGGLAVTVALSKFSGVKNLVATAKKGGSLQTNAYGNSPYGGKTA